MGGKAEIKEIKQYLKDKFGLDEYFIDIFMRRMIQLKRDGLVAVHYDYRQHKRFYFITDLAKTAYVPAIAAKSQ